MRQVIYVNRIFENTLISVIPSRIQLTLILNLEICCIVYDMSISVCCSYALAPGLQQGAYNAIPSNLIPNNCSDCVDPVHILQRSDGHRFRNRTSRHVIQCIHHGKQYGLMICSSYPSKMLPCLFPCPELSRQHISAFSFHISAKPAACLNKNIYLLHVIPFSSLF